MKPHGFNITLISAVGFIGERQKNTRPKTQLFYKLILRTETNGILDGKEQRTAILYQELHSLLQYFPP